MIENRKLKIVITGANGFIGSYLTEFFSQQGHKVYALVHHLYKQAPENVIYRSFEMKSFASDVIPNDTDIVIHTAYIPYKKGTYKENINEIASKRLYNIAKKKNVRKFIFLSSLSASKEAKSEYGKSKYNISKLIDTNVDLVIAPGLVIGKKGLYSKIETIIKNAKIVPLIGGGKQVLQYILINDLARIIQQAIANDIHGEYLVAYHKSIVMKDLYHHIAKLNNKKVIFINFPYFFADIAFGMINLLNLNIGVSKENYLGLKNMKQHKICETKEIFGFELERIAK